MMNPKASSTNIQQPSAATDTDKSNTDKNRPSDLNQSATTNTTITPPTSHPIHSNNQSAGRPLACGRRRRHTISNNHIEVRNPNPERSRSALDRSFHSSILHSSFPFLCTSPLPSNPFSNHIL
jgi:hypothetical protein